MGTELIVVIRLGITVDDEDGSLDEIKDGEADGKLDGL